MNAVVLASIRSAGNSTLYAGSRLLYSMAHTHWAPRIFGRVSRHGVPVWGVLATAPISSLAFLSSFVGDSTVSTWLYKATGLSGFIVWVSAYLAHLGFRAAWRAQDHTVAELPYRAALYPVGTWFALIVFVGVIIGQGIALIMSAGFSWSGLLVADVGLPIAVALYLGFTARHGSRPTPLRDIDLTAGDVQE